MKFKKGISFVLTFCMVLSLFATFVIPVAAAELPEGAVAIDYLGYIHDSYSMVAYAEADMTLGALVNKYLGQVKDLNYCKVAVCDEDGTVTAVYLTLGREPAEGPNGIKTDLTIAAGQFAVIYNANKTGHEVMDDISVGDIVTLYNVDDLKTHTGTAVALEGAGFTVAAAPVTSKVVTDWNPVSYKESVGGATGAFIYDDADIYANCANYWWIHAAFAPSATVEGGYEVVALRPSSGDTVPFLTIPEDGFVWMAWSSAGDTPESSGAYALAFMNELAVGDVVFFKGVDFANKTTAADASAEIWVDPNAPVNVALNKDYTLSGEENATYNAKLTDGNAHGAMTYDNRWFAFTAANTVDKIGTVVVDLGALYDITAIQVNLVNDTGAGVAVPEYANLYVSADGETWSEAIALTVSDANQVAYWAKAEELAVSAQYVKFEVKLGGTFAFLNEIEVYGALAPATSQVVTDWNTSKWGGADEAHIFTNQEAYLACTHTWWSHVSFKPTNFEGVYEVVAVRGATGEAAAYEIAEGGFIWLAHDTAAAGTAGAYAHALIKTLAVGDLVKFDGIDIANCTTTKDATAAKWEAPKADDVVDLKVSHNNLYNWGTFESMIISQPGKTVVDVISQTPYWWIMYVVEEVDGVYVATAYYKNCDEINTTVCPENGFLYYVYSSNSAWEVADEGKLLGYIFNLNDIDLSANMAIDTNENPGNVKYITALNPEALKTGDLNLNGKIDATDYAILRKLVLGTLTAEDIGDLAYGVADVNGDKVVNARDYYLVKRAYLGTYVIPGWETEEEAE